MNIFFPVFFMVLLTLATICRLGYMRFHAAKRGEVDPAFYKAYRDGQEPEHIAVCARNVANLFETPVLFYVLCLIAFTTGQTGTLILSLAWGYVALRIAHSIVHQTSNKIIQRFKIYVASLAVLAAMTVVLLTGLLT